MQHKQLGVYIGTNYCGIPTVADDVTLISHNPIMLNVQAEHANSKRYLVSQQKSSIVVMNGSQHYEWTFNNENL
jgi:phosphohistidine phosphatase SixA